MAMAVAAVFRPRPRLAYSGATRGHGPTYRAPGPTPTLPRALFLPLPLPDNQRSADYFNTCLLDQITSFNVYTFLTLTIYSLITVCHGAAGRSFILISGIQRYTKVHLEAVHKLVFTMYIHVSSLEFVG